MTAMNSLGSQIAKASPHQDGTPRFEPKFALEDGSRGNTSLPPDRDFLKRRLQLQRRRFLRALTAAIVFRRRVYARLSSQGRYGRDVGPAPVSSRLGLRAQRVLQHEWALSEDPAQSQ
jgi:hypothetical protein